MDNILTYPKALKKALNINSATKQENKDYPTTAVVRKGGRGKNMVTSINKLCL